jgi:hypothetical protein
MFVNSISSFFGYGTNSNSRGSQITAEGLDSSAGDGFDLVEHNFRFYFFIFCNV